MKKKSFTLMEIMIIISLIIIIAIIALITLNPKKQIEKSQDSKRKTELTQLQKTLEDWYNDKNCYPRPSEICYDSPSTNNTCHICGNENSSPIFSPYLSSLPCDPQHPTKKYLYQVDDLDCPQMYWIYAKFSNEEDPLISKSSCLSTCSSSNNCNYNIVFNSPNAFENNCQEIQISQSPTAILINTPTTIPTNTPYPTTSSNYYCQDYYSLYIINNNICNICGTYYQCQQSYPNNNFFIDTQCSITCLKNKNNIQQIEKGESF